MGTETGSSKMEEKELPKEEPKVKVTAEELMELLKGVSARQEQ